MPISFHPFGYPVNCPNKDDFLRALAADLGQPAAEVSAQQDWYVDSKGCPQETPDDCDAKQPYTCVILYTNPSDRIVLQGWPVDSWGRVSGAPDMADTFTHADGHDVVYLTEDLHDDLVSYWQSLNMGRDGL